MFSFIRVNQTRLRGETLHPIRIQVQLPHQVGIFSLFRKSHVVLVFMSSEKRVILAIHPVSFIFMSQEMEACRRLPIMPPQVHLETPHLAAWGGPTAGHLETERLKLLLQDPRQRQNHQLPLAMAGTLDVPKDETGALGCPCFSLPSPKFPPSQPMLRFQAKFSDFCIIFTPDNLHIFHA